MLIYNFLTGETKVISKYSNIGGQWIEEQQILRFYVLFFLELKFTVQFPCCISCIYSWCLKKPKESSRFKSVMAAETWLSNSMLLCVWQITSDYLIFMVSPLNLIPMLTVYSQWHWLHIVSLSASHTSVEISQIRLRSK